MMKKTIIILFCLLPGLWVSAQQVPGEDISRDYMTAASLLRQSKAGMPADSVLLQKELERIQNVYAELSDSLKKQASPAIYAGFETQRLTSLCYMAQSLPELKERQARLFEHVAIYHNDFVNVDSVNEEIAKCLVNSYEMQSIWFEDSLLFYVTSAMSQHMASLGAWSNTPAQNQAFVDQYAAQYYKRGIISMAEPVFRHFRDYFRRPDAKNKSLDLFKDYTVANPGLRPTGRTFGSFHSDKIIIIAGEESPYDLIYLISELRTAAESYPRTPVFIFRDSSNVSEAYFQALRRNLSKAGYYIISPDKEDMDNALDYACCSYQNAEGELVYATNNPADFLEWLEKPLAAGREARSRQLHRNYKNIMARKDSLASLPPDTTIRYQGTQGRVKLAYRGYWQEQPRAEVSQYYFTGSSQNLTDTSGLPVFKIYYESSPVFSGEFMATSDTLEISLTADPMHKIIPEFSNGRNRHWSRLSHAVDSLMNLKNACTYLAESYPFRDGDFMKAINARSLACEKMIMEKINNAGQPEKSFLALKYNTGRLYKAAPPEKITWDDMETYFPADDFDTLSWRSPYYSTWLNAWLSYGSKDQANAIDLLYASVQIVPDKAVREVSQYLWDKMNAQGKFDMMVHLDTTWLTGCSGITDIDTRKRIEGYKRMAPGKKAPDISWDEAGNPMNLYSLEADTIIVVFWSDDCGHCQKELPEMYENLSGKPGFEVVAVAIDKDESSIKTGMQYMEKWHHVWAENGWSDSLPELYNVSGTPEMYVLDKDCKIKRKAINY